MRSRWVLVLFSAVFPGLGQFVAGRRERGLAILGGWLAIPALYGIIMVAVEQLATTKGFPSDQLANFLTTRYWVWGQVEIGSLSYAMLCLAMYWLLNLFDAAACASEK